MELLTFGDFIRFYKFYYSGSAFSPVSISILNSIKSLRNAVLHNTCILADLSSGTSQPRQN
ncbi:MAG: Abi family protein [Lachnospiraceae bacterium]|nr:Abi family protein [Lachnospiraceae bacterium]